jgi:hypothetical protein
MALKMVSILKLKLYLLPEPRHQPFKNGNVAVDGNVDVFKALTGRDVPEVSHLAEEQICGQRMAPIFR